ncbi:MAG: cytochrome c3 family protein [Desulfuromonadaceae bacterium]
MKQLFVALLSTGLLSFSLLIGAAFAEVPSEVKFPSGKMGEVTFNHTSHQEAGTCAVCHHTGVEAGACRTCHGQDTAIPDMKKAAHDMCKNCHKKDGGPTGCKDCHVK